MSQQSEYIAELVYKFNNGLISPEETQTLLEWYNGHDDQYVVVNTRADESAKEVKSRMLKGLLARLTNDPVKPLGARRVIIKWISAAAAILLLALGTWLLLPKEATKQSLKLTSTTIEPGGNKATLTLADGRTIALSASQAGIIAGKQITYTNGAAVDQMDMAGIGSTALLSLHTPRGGTYNIVLPDGTQVWLNAESTLKYPSQFSEGERVVELEGEAYFQVKTLYRPEGAKVSFKVISKRQNVEVLGTQFNMSAYPEQLAGKTTLVEGKVAIKSGEKSTFLAPNEQAISMNGNTKVKQVNVKNYIAWREGKFSFDGKTFEETMSEIGRWYDLDVVYENGIPEEELIGDAYRNQKIGFVLRLLDVADIDYKLEVAQRRLIIKGKKKT